MIRSPTSSYIAVLFLILRGRELGATMCLLSSQRRALRVRTRDNMADLGRQVDCTAKPPGEMSSKCCQLKIVADSQAGTVRLAGASQALAARLDNAAATGDAKIMSMSITKILGSRIRNMLYFSRIDRKCQVVWVTPVTQAPPYLFILLLR